MKEIKEHLEKHFALHDVENIIEFLLKYSKYYWELEHYSEDDFNNFIKLDQK